MTGEKKKSPDVVIDAKRGPKCTRPVGDKPASLKAKSPAGNVKLKLQAP